MNPEHSTKCARRFVFLNLDETSVVFLRLAYLVQRRLVLDFSRVRLAVNIGCADDRRRIIRVNSNDALRTSVHPICSVSYRTGYVLSWLVWGKSICNELSIIIEQKTKIARFDPF